MGKDNVMTAQQQCRVQKWSCEKVQRTEPQDVIYTLLRSCSKSGSKGYMYKGSLHEGLFRHRS